MSDVTFDDPEFEDRNNHQVSCTTCGASVHTHWEERHVEWHAMLAAALRGLPGGAA